MDDYRRELQLKLSQSLEKFDTHETLTLMCKELKKFFISPPEDEAARKLFVGKSLVASELSIYLFARWIANVSDAVVEEVEEYDEVKLAHIVISVENLKRLWTAANVAARNVEKQTSENLISDMKDKYNVILHRYVSMISSNKDLQDVAQTSITALVHAYYWQAETGTAPQPWPMKTDQSQSLWRHLMNKDFAMVKLISGEDNCCKNCRSRIFSAKSDFAIMGCCKKITCTSCSEIAAQPDSKWKCLICSNIVEAWTTHRLVLKYQKEEKSGPPTQGCSRYCSID